jgi:hypothetical protein
VTDTLVFLAAPEKEGIQDMTETDLINMRRTIYLTIMNSLNFEEAVHKLLNVQIPPGNEVSDAQRSRKAGPHRISLFVDRAV